MDKRHDKEQTGITPEEDAHLRKFAEDMSAAIERGMLEMQHTWRIPLTSITVGWNRMELERDQARTHLIEIRIWWHSETATGTQSTHT